MMQVTCKHCHHDCLCISSSRARSICGCLSLATFSSVRISLLGRGWNTSACLELSPPKRQTNKYSHCKTDSNNAPLRKKKKKNIQAQIDFQTPIPKSTPQTWQNTITAPRDRPPPLPPTNRPTAPLDLRPERQGLQAPALHGGHGDGLPDHLAELREVLL